MAERLSAEQRNRIADRITKAYRASHGLADLIFDASLADAEIDRLQAQVEHLGTELADAVAQCVQLEKAEDDLTKRLKTQEEWVERWMSAAAQNESDLLLAKAEVERLKAERQDALTAKREDKPHG